MQDSTDYGIHYLTFNDWSNLKCRKGNVRIVGKFFKEILIMVSTPPPPKPATRWVKETESGKTFTIDVQQKYTKWYRSIRYLRE